MIKTITTLCAILIFNATYSQQQDNIGYLKTFAKAYGYVKYFHPSDEASKIDWNSFAAFGSSEIIKCNNTAEVIATLEKLFKPIAPSVVFSNKQKDFDMTTIIPRTTEGFEPTFWQHKGVSTGMNNQNGIYNSTRVNRITEIDDASDFGNLFLSINAEKYIGKEIKYTGWVKVEKDSQGTGHLWLRVDKKDKSIGFFENMGSTPITSNEWKKYEIIGTVDDLASELIIGCYLLGKGTLFLDNVHIYYKENHEWIEIPIKNNDFEADTIVINSQRSDWMGTGKGYSQTISNTEIKEGKNSAVIASQEFTKKIKGVSQFAAYPILGELIDKQIGDGVFCQISLNLYGNNENTYPKSNTLKTLQKNLKNSGKNLNNLDQRLGNVINTYNVFQHFYPYFDEVDVDWDKALETALQKSLNDKTDSDHLITLQKFTAPLKDGHIFISGGVVADFVPPINWEWIEDKLVITKVKDDHLGIKIGDIVTKVNGESSEAYFNEINSRISAGTSEYLNYRAQSSSLFGEKDEKLDIEINDKTVALNRDKKYDYREKDISIQENDYKLLDNNIYYLNLDTIEMDSITALLPKLQKARGIICDLRGYPNGNHEFISHLLKEKDTSKAWMRIPKIIYPDQEKIVGYENNGWEMGLKSPYLGDKNVVFIIDGRSISYAESFMSFIEGYQLATIVGQPTAGTNGNINPFTILGNFTIYWTGMKVVKHNGTQHHGIGIMPDIYVEKTIEGIKARKDEFLEKAIEVILR